MTVPLISQLLEGLPTNWGRWGADDELGALNFLTEAEVARGVASITTNKVFTIASVINHPKGDPTWPGRTAATVVMTQDRASYRTGKRRPFPGGIEVADDTISMFLQGSTQFDALGHIWFDGKLYNGYDADTTTHGMGKASVLPLAQKSATGHGVLVDLPRFFGKKRLDKGQAVSLQQLLDCAAKQGTTIQKHDILLVRTGWVPAYHELGAAAFYAKPFIEPGLTFSRDLVTWFHDLEIPLLGTDSMGNEVTVDPESGVVLPLHGALMRNLGVVFNEINLLEDLADDCAADGKYDFLYAAAPLKISRATGAPVNPICIK